MLRFPWLNLKIISRVLLILIILLLSAYPAICENKNSKLPKDTIEMTLADSVFLALRKNRTIKSAYLDRISQKFDLEVAEAKFRPVLNIDLSTQYASSRDVSSKSASVSGSASAKVTQNVPTGGQFIFRWANTEDRKIQPSRENSYTTSFGITFTQPFLKGGGFETANASVDIARLTEQINIL
jgi:outer membrane protein TolC